MAEVVCPWGQSTGAFSSTSSSQARLQPGGKWSILDCGQAMIEPLGRGVDPGQLAFHALVTMGVRPERMRAESPLAVALDELGVDLAHGEHFTTAEAKQFVSL